MEQLSERGISPLIVKYYEIMKNYRNGIYGNNHLTMHEILEKAGVPNLFNEMSLEEIEYLIKTSTSGMTKMMFIAIKKQKETLVLANPQKPYSKRKQITQ